MPVKISPMIMISLNLVCSLVKLLLKLLLELLLQLIKAIQLQPIKIT